MLTKIDIGVLGSTMLQAARAERIGVTLTLIDPLPPRNVYVSEAAAELVGWSVEELLERDAMQMDMLQRGVLLSLCRATGNPDDTAKTLEKFKTPEVSVPRDVFLFNVAKMLQEDSALYSSNKLDHPGRYKAVLTEALEAAQAVPQSKESKALVDKIQAALKKASAT